jgi:hypothetical protein
MTDVIQIYSVLTLPQSSLPTATARPIKGGSTGPTMTASRSGYMDQRIATVFSPNDHFSKAKICFQSSFMLMTIHPSFFALS